MTSRSKKANTILLARQFHQRLVWLAIAALALFILSALTHPIMVWTGPQASKFFPPTMTISEQTINGVMETLKNLNGKNARIVKVVPTQQGPMLQVTTEPTQPREYYPLSNYLPHSPLQQFDRQQAEWLARYYTGTNAAIKSIKFIDSFSNQYPSVNRLLPVYKINFDTPDQLSVYIHTETNALASINNNWKTSLQTIFQWFHTWSWLDNYPTLRVSIVLILLLSLLTISVAGITLLATVKRSQSKTSSQRYHRKLAWFIAMPFLGLILSAGYHLLQSEYGEAPIGMRLYKPITINTPGEILNADSLKGIELSALSLLDYQGELYFRASKANGAAPASTKPHQHHEKASDNDVRNKRFDGQTKERGALYLTTAGDNTALSDEVVVASTALTYLSATADKLTLEHVTHFGADYDFRNKRLPVWRVTIDNAEGDKLFIDPVTGILVDHIKKAQGLERLSFSLLHKWNILVPLLGREGRDIVVVVFLLVMVGFGVMGIRLKR